MFSIHILLPRQIPIYWAKPSIPHSTMKEHPDIVKFCHFSAYVRTRSAGILRGLTPWHTDFGTKSSVLHLVRGVQAPGTHVRSDYPQTRHIGGRPSSHKANLIPQSKRQDTTIIVIPCLCSFTVPSSPSAEPPINKKRTRTLSRKESGSSTNCLVDDAERPRRGGISPIRIISSSNRKTYPPLQTCHNTLCSGGYFMFSSSNNTQCRWHLPVPSRWAH